MRTNNLPSLLGKALLNSSPQLTAARVFGRLQSSASTSVNYVNDLRFDKPLNNDKARPAYRVLAPDGKLVGPVDPALGPDRQVSLYKSMLRLQTLDQIMFESHRQGRISFYMTGFGEEAAQLGSAAALQPEDWVYAQYREAGVLLERGASVDQLLAQCFGNQDDSAKGRQMPIHYGDSNLNYVTVSSPLGTQLPQAAGSAYSLKLSASSSSGSPVVVCYFGEGAASTGDAHAAMNFASTLQCPVIFFCRNNQYAISTPSTEQYAGDGIVSRASGYGMSSIRVDGNDLFAVYAACREARLYSSSEGRPVLVEAMTYRLGHHSTSDDSSAYRPAGEVDRMRAESEPLTRVRIYLVQEGLWNDDRERETRELARAEVLASLSRNEQIKRAPVGTMFDDVYHELPESLVRQKSGLARHLEKFGQHYPLHQHQGI